MPKTIFHYFFDFFDGQEQWLNKQAEKGLRLVKCGRLSYTFENCRPGEFEYVVDFVGDKSYRESNDYRSFLQDTGYHVIPKNINVNYSIGKIKWRPWGTGLGQVSTSPGTYNQELLIIEKKRDGTPFHIHSDIRDRLTVIKKLRNAYLYAVVVLCALLALSFTSFITSPFGLPALWIARILIICVGAAFSIPTVKYAALASRLKTESRISER